MSAKLVAPREAQSISRLSLIFKPGHRPSADEIVHLSCAGLEHGGEAGRAGFAVSYRPEPAAGWLELLAGGLTFDLSGLAPAEAAPMPTIAHFYGFAADAAGAGLTAGPAAAIALAPGEQLHGGERLLPVMRIMAGLAAQLTQLAEVTAVVWHPARCAMAPAAFAAAIARWLSGGVFPALGLTALFRDVDGAIRSEGLEFFIGQELWIDPTLSKNTTVYAKIATRLINRLVGIGTIHQPFEIAGPDGEQLSVVPSDNGGFLRIWGKT